MKAVNPNSQSMLAKLLAKENINVSVGDYHTAFFDVKNRILGLPSWNSENKQVSDLLVGHEVGHALYTPFDAIERFHNFLPGAPFTIANIVEDIRVERKVRTDYPGLVYSFKEGYRYFIEKDFFEIANKDLKKMGLVDRLNLKGKIGNLIDIPLSKKEKEIHSRCLLAETYDDVLDICKEIYDLVKNEKSETSDKSTESSNDDKPSNVPSSGGQESDKDESDQGESDKDESDKDESDKDESGKGESDKDESGKGESDQGGDQESDKDESGKGDDQQFGNNHGDDFDPDYSDLSEQFGARTQNDFDSKLQNLQQNLDNVIVVNAPTESKTLDCVVSIDEVMSERKKARNYHEVMNNEEFIDEFKKFKSLTKKHIAVLIKEFERKKSAFQYSRARQSNSGAIDVNRLHSYKFEDQIFKSVTTLADAKSHGMVFFIDYSGSMYNTIEQVIDQVLQLVYFCKAVGIQFEVYGFTGAYSSSYYNDKQNQRKNLVDLFGKSIDFKYTSIFQLLNSDMKKEKFELSVRELKAQIFKRKECYNGYSFNIPSVYEIMSSTPLNETIIVAHDIVKKFKTKHNIQKMNTIFLSDGDGGAMIITDNIDDLNYRKNRDDRYFSSPSPKYVTTIHGREVNLHNRNQIKQKYSSLIENLKITCGTTVIGFFVAQNSRSLKTHGIDCLRINSGNKADLAWVTAAENLKKLIKKNKNDKCICIAGAFNYDSYFIFENNKKMNINSDQNFGEETPNETRNYNNNSSQKRLAKDFVKFNSEKRTSRVFLNKFVETIA